FRKHISKGGMILDAGCGVGRDTRYFIQHGYKVVSFDASERMVQLCSQYPFAYCRQQSFADIESIQEFDAVCLCFLVTPSGR
ncbi:MAG: class I SAM-dependent methyltransferase, partial [Chlorobium sp.]|nr:class I SAM-dependent methyltransferase [Chlorobium sp.]